MNPEGAGVDTSRAPRKHASRGFGAAVVRVDDLCPATDGRGQPHLLRVPGGLVRDAGRIGWSEAGTGDEGWSCILAERFPEGLGSLEGWAHDAARRLRPDGRLVLSLENMACARHLRRCIEGRPGSLDPFGVPGERDVPFEIPRAVRALSAAGLVVRDVVEARSWNEDVRDDFLAEMFRQGFLAARFVWGRPTARFWAVADKVASPLVSCLIAVTDHSDAAAIRITEEAIAQALPDAQVVRGAASERDVDSWNEAVPRSAGRWLWLLRAGDAPTREDFEALADKVEFGPAAPVAAEGDVSGDLGGLLVARDVLFSVGPFPREWRSEQIAGEDWLLRAELCAHRAEPVVCGFRGVRPRPGPVEEECARLFERYGAFRRDKRRAGGDATPGTDGPTTDVTAAVPWAGRRPRVSLCMIAKNEERFLAGCIERALPAVDEIVLVDTGSTDRTIEIARSFGAKVIETPWIDDFSAPRNAGLQAATGDWILVLDADELLADGAADKIRAAVEDAEAAGYYFTFYNQHETLRSPGVLMVRLFRNLPGIRWQNRIHEQIVPTLLEESESRKLRLLQSEIEVLHYGYSAQVMTERGKLERNIRLFKLHLGEHADDVYNLYKYADFLRCHEPHAEEAFAVLQTCWAELLERPAREHCNFPFAAEVAALLALDLARRNRDAEARDVIGNGLQRFIPTPNLHYVAGEFAMKDGRPSEAIEHYRRCLAFRGMPLVVPITDGLTSHVGVTGLAAAFIARGEVDRGEVLLRGVLRHKPGHEAAALHLSCLLARRQPMTEALEPLMACLKARPESFAARFQGAVLLLRLGMPAFAARWAEMAVESGKVPLVEAWRVLAEARMLAGERGAARTAFAVAAEKGDEIARVGVFFLDKCEGRPCELPRGIPAARVGELMRAWASKIETAGRRGARSTLTVAQDDELLAADR